MKCDKKNLLLYAVTDRRWLGKKSLYDAVKESLDGGVTFVQLREKDLDEENFRTEAESIKKLCHCYHVPFVINDNVQLAIDTDADGVHVGQDDMGADDVRQKMGPDKILGVSAHNVEEAVLAEKMGADYLGVGAVFATGSKDDASVISLETVKEICKSVSIPVIAIGGIMEENVRQLKGSGIAGVAVISALFAQKDIQSAAEKLKEAVSETVNL